MHDLLGDAFAPTRSTVAAAVAVPALLLVAYVLAPHRHVKYGV